MTRAMAGSVQGALGVALSTNAISLQTVRYEPIIWTQYSRRLELRIEDIVQITLSLPTP